MGCNIHTQFQKKTPDGWENIETQYQEGRHYQLFAVLADACNCYGVEGIHTGGRVQPIALPRYFPEDFGEVSKWLGDHTFSWLTGRELLEWYYSSLPLVKKTGIISVKEYGKWDKKSEPSVYYGQIFGDNIIVTEDPENDVVFTHVRVTWKEDLKKSLKYFFDEIQRLVEEHGEIRMVFGFDS